MMLETKRLILREMALHDVDDLFEVFSDPEVMQFYPQPRRVTERNGMKLMKEIEWRSKLTCVYAVKHSNSAA